MQCSIRAVMRCGLNSEWSEYAWRSVPLSEDVVEAPGRYDHPEVVLLSR